VVVASQIINTAYNIHNECNMSPMEMSEVFVVEKVYRHGNV